MRWIIVLGMHRSGTSAFAHAVGSLGASMGNPAGMMKHFEQVPLRRVNEKLLRSVDGSWDTPPPVGWLDGTIDPKLVDLGRRVTKEQFPDGDVAVWKDPRTCLTVPFWLEVLPPDPVFLIIYRHPTEVAASLAGRNRMGPGHGYGLWERHNADALKAIVGRPTLVLDYPSVVGDPIGQLHTVKSALTSFGIELPNDPATADHGLVPQQRHHVAADAEALDPIATESQRALFATLNTLRGSHEALALPEPIADPHPLSAEIFKMARKVRRQKQARRQSRSSDSDVAAGEDGDDEGAGAGDAGTAKMSDRDARRANRKQRKERKGRQSEAEAEGDDESV